MTKKQNHGRGQSVLESQLTPEQ